MYLTIDPPHSQIKTFHVLVAAMPNALDNVVVRIVGWLPKRPTVPLLHVGWHGCDGLIGTLSG